MNNYEYLLYKAPFYIPVNCGTSMIDRLQNAGNTMENEVVYDRLMLTW